MEPVSSWVERFNPKSPTIMHLDLNSCFASIEQQANPFLRGRPIAVAAYTGPSGCILAPSVEAKRLGVKTGMRVKEGKLLCRDLVVLPPDPDKYRDVHRKFRKLLADYCDRVTPKSIDEFVLDLEGYPAYKLGMEAAAGEIKRRIRAEIGDWLRVSVGIGPNRFLAKTAAGLHKPDGLDVISVGNFEKIYRSLQLMDLCGIKRANCVRLGGVGVFSVWDFFLADSKKLQRAFASVVGQWWYLRLHGWEIDDVIFGRRSYGNSYALPKPLSTPEELAPILTKLVEKTGMRMRVGGYHCRGVHVAVVFRDGGGFWHHGEKTAETLFDSRDIYKKAFDILCRCPYRSPVAILSESCFDLVPAEHYQPGLFEDWGKKKRLTEALDQVNSRFGDFVITPAMMLGARESVPDRIAFGGVKELEEVMQ